MFPRERDALLYALMASGCYYIWLSSHSLTCEVPAQPRQEEKHLNFELRREVGGVPKPSDCYPRTICPVLLLGTEHSL